MYSPPPPPPPPPPPAQTHTHTYRWSKVIKPNYWSNITIQRWYKSKPIHYCRILIVIAKIPSGWWNTNSVCFIGFGGYFSKCTNGWQVRTTQPSRLFGVGMCSALHVRCRQLVSDLKWSRKFCAISWWRHCHGNNFRIIGYLWHPMIESIGASKYTNLSRTFSVTTRFTLPNAKNE